MLPTRRSDMTRSRPTTFLADVVPRVLRAARGPVVSAVGAPRRISPERRLRPHEWSPVDRTVVIVLLAIAFGCLFLLTYSLALGDPVPRRIDAALVGDPAAQPRTVNAVEGVTSGKLDFRRYASVPAEVE